MRGEDYYDIEKEMELNLLHHARLGLKRIHQRCSTSSTTSAAVTLPTVPQTKENTSDKPLKENASISIKSTSPKSNKEKNSPTKEEKSEKKYLSLKKPVEKSIYYQHSKQGMKYWYEEKKPKTYSSKVPMGRKGMMLGLVDAPLK